MSGPITPAPVVPYPGAVWTGLDIVKRAMRAAHVLMAGETPPGPEANDALVILNQMLDAWDADKLSIYTMAIEDFPLVSGKQAYTMGPDGADFVTVNSNVIEQASVLIANGALEYPLELYTSQDWQDVSLKAVTAIPQGVYADQNVPVRNLQFWPIPQDAFIFRTYLWQTLKKFTALNMPMQFAPGYAEAVMYNLALRIAVEWPGELTQALQEAARISLATIRSFNIEPSEMKCDPMFLQGGEGGVSMAAFLKG